jgi:hypothetical protein
VAERSPEAGVTPWALSGTSSSTRRLTLPTLAWLIPLTIAAGYLILFVVLLPHNIERLRWNPSVASAFVMPETLVETGSGTHTVMGSSPQWVSLWFGLLTAKLPLHRELWGFMPTAMFILTALIVGWSVAQLATRRAAVLAVLLILVASPLALMFFMAPFSHNTVYPCTALMGAYLIWLTRSEGRKQFVTLLVPPALGIVVGTCLSSDFLLSATAVIPLAIMGILAGLRRERRSRLVALSALTTVVVSLPVAKITSEVMKSSGYLTLPSPIKYAATSELGARAELLFKGLKVLFNGFLGPEYPGTLHAELGIASVIVMCAALLTLIVVGCWTTGRFIVTGLRKDSASTPIEQARSLHISYWVASTACACGAFWIAGEGPTTTHESYYANALFAVGAVIPLLLFARSPFRWLIPAGATLFFAASFVALTHDYFNTSDAFARDAGRIEQLARANHVKYGYTNFGDASGITWGTDNAVIARPVMDCENPEGINLCPGFQAFVPAWYTPQQRRTFLLVDPVGIEVRALPPNLGRPLASYTVGAMRLYIYPYDLASRFGRVF